MRVSSSGGDRAIMDRALPAGATPGMVTYRRGDRALNDRGIGKAGGGPPPPSVPHLLNGLVSYWKMDDPGPGTRADSVGTNNLTDFYGNVPAAAGIINDGANFGASTVLLIPSPATPMKVSGAFTFSFWLNLTSQATVPIIPLAKWYSNGDYYFVYNGAGSGFAFVVIGPGGAVATPTTPIVANGTWHHFVGWFDSSAFTVNIRMDDTVTLTNAVGGNVGDGSTHAFTIGTADNLQYPLTGIVDEVGFWHRKLTPGEITQLYNGGNGWPLGSFTP